MILRVDLNFQGHPVDQMKIRVFSEAYASSMASYVSKIRHEMEMHAKKKHPWTNRTGRAERGLHTKLDTSDAGWRQTITLAHGDDVWYGYFLENAMGKEYAIIEPTMKVFEARVSKELGQFFDEVRVQ